MFNGIVETVGTLESLQAIDQCLQLTIAPAEVFDDLRLGDSVAVNGVCLTITHLTEKNFNVTVVPETLRVTHLSMLTQQQLVNLERSMPFNHRVSGHFLQGHVDTTGEIIELDQAHNGVAIVKIRVPISLTRYIVNKGYIALDGMSITVIEAREDWFTVTLIPHTQQVTIAKQYTIGSLVNIEVDILAKYLEKLMGQYHVSAS